MKDNGGPAYPVDIGEGTLEYPKTRHYPGMSLRDWFAGQAMAAIIKEENQRAKKCDKEGACYYDDWGPINTNVANQAYWMADAMLAERAKE